MIAERPLQAGLIQSELVTYPNRQGRRIVACLDRQEGDFQLRPFVIIAPKYGETKKNNLHLAYFLAANGLNVLRFDYTNHVGESDGEMSRFTLPEAVHDIIASLDYLEQNHGVRQAGLIAHSLSSRMAVRAAALDNRIGYLINLMGVVNIQRTLTIVYHEDVVAGHLAGKRWGVNDVLGFPIDFERFLGALAASGLHTLESTGADLARIMVPVAFFAAEKDAWVDLDDVRGIVHCAPQSHFIPVRDALHEVRENPAAADQTFLQLVQLCLGWAHGREFAAEEIQKPGKRSFVHQNKIERDRLRQACPERQSEAEFWAYYLSKYRFFESVDVYQCYLNLVGDLLGEFRPGELVFDAGCGNGLFGVWALRHLLDRERAKHRLVPPPVYVGIDLTAEGLLDSLGRHTEVQRRLFAHSVSDSPRMNFVYGHMDLDRLGRRNGAETNGPHAGNGNGAGQAVKFADGTFEKICCSLLLSYLQDPAALLLQLHRLLRPGGRIVVSSMKPFCDLSLIYRRYAADRHTEHEIESARDLLRAAGRIKVKEEQGYYTFFSAEELQDMMRAAGFVNLQAYPSFGSQANVVRAEK